MGEETTAAGLMPGGAITAKPTVRAMPTLGETLYLKYREWGPMHEFNFNTDPIKDGEVIVEIVVKDIVKANVTKVSLM